MAKQLRLDVTPAWSLRQWVRERLRGWEFRQRTRLDRRMRKNAARRGEKQERAVEDVGTGELF
jgi:hypothetical protein